MGHMHPHGMVKAIEAKAVVIPEHLTLEMVIWQIDRRVWPVFDSGYEEVSSTR
jgi:hypothetical protein